MNGTQVFLNNFAKKNFGRSLSEAKQKKVCVICGKKVNLKIEFRDRLSLKEYKISGLCQKCQNSTFIKI